MPGPCFSQSRASNDSDLLMLMHGVQIPNMLGNIHNMIMSELPKPLSEEPDTRSVYNQINPSNRVHCALLLFFPQLWPQRCPRDLSSGLQSYSEKCIADTHETLLQPRDITHPLVLPQPRWDIQAVVPVLHNDIVVVRQHTLRDGLNSIDARRAHGMEAKHDQGLSSVNVDFTSR